MNTKQLFFFSLILLSIAMGVNWFKNRPKTAVVKEPVQTRKAVDFNDKDFQETEKKQVEDQDDEDDEDDEEEDEEKIKLASASKKYEGEVQNEVDSNENGQKKNEDEEEDDDDDKKDKSNEIQKENNSVLKGKTEIASGTLENKQPDSDGFVPVEILKDDPIMQEYNQITKNPFELSPYAKLVEKLKKEQEIAARPVVAEKKVVKVPKLMSNLRFTGTIETERGPKAIVDGSLYEKGNDLNGYTVKEIKKNVMFLVSGKDDFIVPKTGVKVDIDPQTGEFSINDSYEN